jgi:translation initiation factor 2B subunit (eIF-2B alpha/beta/delta family)
MYVTELHHLHHLFNTHFALTTWTIYVDIISRKLPEDIRAWEKDRVNGAAFLARQAVTLASAYTKYTHNAERSDCQPSMARSIAMLRPSMVAIVNAMNEFDRRVQTDPNIDRVGEDLRRSLDGEIGRCVDLGYETILHHYRQWKLTSPHVRGFVIGTFSRSSTTKMILERVLQNQVESSEVKVLCSQSTPGDEGELMAADVPGARCLPDQEFQKWLEDGNIDLVLVGADCILEGGKGVVNKVGTASLATCCERNNVPIICCADRWKVWEDDYPPGLEDIFETFIPANLDHVLVPDCESESYQMTGVGSIEKIISGGQTGADRN